MIIKIIDYKPIIFTELSEIRSFSKKFSNDEKNRILNIANDILQNKIEILGSFKTSGKLNWHKDFVNNFEWPHEFYTKLHSQTIGFYPYDKKIPWELSRFQFSFYLLIAFILTNNKKYINHLLDLIGDWIDKNPPYYGINWMNAMEVGIRASNLILVISILSEYIDARLYKKIKETLLYHYFYIVNNAEISFNPKLSKMRAKSLFTIYRANHYLFNLSGLIFITIYLNKKLFYKRYIKLFYKEINHQLLKDGVNFEGSIGYHGLALECILETLLLVKKYTYLDIEIDIKNRLQMALDFILCYTKDSGEFPVIGDNDSGSYINVCRKTYNSHLHILNKGLLLFKNPKYKLDKSNFTIEDYFFFGDGGYKLFTEYEPYKVNGYYSFQSGGFYILRENGIYLIVNAFDLFDIGTGGHIHNDPLNFELSNKGFDIFIDPGNYLYQNYKMRQYFKSQKNHNCVFLNDYNEEVLHPTYPFLSLNRDRVKILKSNYKNNKFSLEGLITNKSVSSDYEIKREITCDSKLKILVIKDNFIKLANKTIGWNFNISQDFEIKSIIYPNIFLENINQNLFLKLSIESNYKVDVTVVEGFFARSYGRLQKSKKIQISTKLCYLNESIKLTAHIN